MKWIVTTVILMMLLVSCGPQATPPPLATIAPEPTPNVEATARAVVGAALAEYEPPVPAPDIVPMFNQGDAQVFMDDADVTDQFDTVEAFYQDRVLVFWAEQPSDKLSNDVGTVMLVPNLIQDRFRFGGIGPKMAGTARLTNRGGDGAIGTAYWIDGPDGRDSVVIQVDGEVVHGVAGGADHPFDFHNGVIIHVTIPVP